MSTDWQSTQLLITEALFSNHLRPLGPVQGEPVRADESEARPPHDDLPAACLSERLPLRLRRVQLTGTTQQCVDLNIFNIKAKLWQDVLAFS